MKHACQTDDDRLTRVTNAAYRNGDPWLTRVESPRDELEKSEEADIDELQKGLSDAASEREKQMMAGAKLLLRHIFSKGIGWDEVMRQFYPLADLMMPEMFSHLTLEQRAKLFFNETKQNYSTRRKVLLLRLGLGGVNGTGFSNMKSATANYKGRKKAIA